MMSNLVIHFDWVGNHRCFLLMLYTGFGVEISDVFIRLFSSIYTLIPRKLFVYVVEFSEKVIPL